MENPVIVFASDILIRQDKIAISEKSEIYEIVVCGIIIYQLLSYRVNYHKRCWRNGKGLRMGLAEKAIEQLWKEGYFDAFKPLSEKEEQKIGEAV
ncbi:hypothetical protein F7734_22275 [Scytonema sp. UIC 10036]|uniref:hypothetical protein n=1 Tax=Scytonema sp. UIC 10036 TaxID=2304196 RepID=UPI0012DA6DCE|nr:hypothetical protein [Scytonema sp. UIC 10036]MUG94943.1 hypothetical protein [Scytonema sp. UIC 10036]